MLDLSNKRVLVTGAGGCIGAWAIKLLLDQNATPVAYDLSDNKDRLRLICDRTDEVAWEQGDISDFDALNGVIQSHGINAIIHLAALQVPFCKADPVGSTRVNIMGSINILETARQHGIKHISYASSVAAPAMGGNDWLDTLYGAHKVCGEQMASVYWQDWQIPSVGIRPWIIYGPGRDQGMSAAPSIAMLAAFAGKAYEVPFTGDVGYVHVEDAAQRFIAAIARDVEGAPVFNMLGHSRDTQAVIDDIQTKTDSAQLSCSGSPMPFPAGDNDGELDTFLQLPAHRSFSQGIDDTLAVFEASQASGFLTNSLIDTLIEKNS